MLASASGRDVKFSNARSEAAYRWLAHAESRKLQLRAAASIAEPSRARGRRYQSEVAFDPRENTAHAGAAIRPVAKKVQQFGPEFHTRLTRSGDA